MPPGMEPINMAPTKFPSTLPARQVQQPGDAGQNHGMGNVGSDHDLGREGIKQ